MWATEEWPVVQHSGKFPVEKTTWVSFRIWDQYLFPTLHQEKLSTGEQLPDSNSNGGSSQWILRCANIPAVWQLCIFGVAFCIHWQQKHSVCKKAFCWRTIIWLWLIPSQTKDSDYYYCCYYYYWKRNGNVVFFVFLSWMSIVYRNKMKGTFPILNFHLRTYSSILLLFPKEKLSDFSTEQYFHNSFMHWTQLSLHTCILNSLLLGHDNFLLVKLCYNVEIA